MKKQTSGVTKFGTALLIIGAILALILLFGVLLITFGFIAFLALGEVEYFMDYVLLDGYYGFINLLFVLDYISLFIGGFAFPTLIIGLICRIVGRKKDAAA